VARNVCDAFATYGPAVLRYTKDDWTEWNVTIDSRMTFADKVRKHFAVGCLGRRGGVGRLDPPASEPEAAANDVSVAADDDGDAAAVADRTADSSPMAPSGTVADVPGYPQASADRFRGGGTLRKHQQRNTSTMARTM
jgi:hypothetical protein